KSAALAEILNENLSTAILDKKPWGKGKQWQDGEVLFEELSEALLQDTTCPISTVHAAHTLGEIYSGAAAHHLSSASLLEPAKADPKLCVDFVTSWNTKCGIAEFTRFYYDVIKDLVDVKIYPNQAANLVRSDEKIVTDRVWEVHKQPSFLIKLLSESSAPIIHIQYTEGFFRVQDIVDIFSCCKGKKFLLTCHNTLYLKPETQREKEILNTAHYVVHQGKDLQQLLDNGISEENIHLIPLGQV
ncbi:MAG: hypothetical protein RR135_05280, partial [Oscillospiraceae bacterium]